MRDYSFGTFVDKKKRDALKELKLIEKVLKSNGLRVENHLEDNTDDPYIFCFNHLKNGSFDGIRIYKIANSIAFRVQKESETHPYGRAYQLPIEDMFEDFLEDEKTSEKEAGKKVMDCIVKEVRKFFEKSAEIEKEERMEPIEGGDDALAIRQQGTDYSALIHSKT